MSKLFVGSVLDSWFRPFLSSYKQRYVQSVDQIINNTRDTINDDVNNLPSSTYIFTAYALTHSWWLLIERLHLSEMKLGNDLRNHPKAAEPLEMRHGCGVCLPPSSTQYPL
jgi:hypothetical protein